jgi:hypothetical protein
MGRAGIQGEIYDPPPAFHVACDDVLVEGLENLLGPGTAKNRDSGNTANGGDACSPHTEGARRGARGLGVRFTTFPLPCTPPATTCKSLENS